VIQIASMVTEHGSDRLLVRNVMTLGSCAPIVGSEVMSFATEEELLKARRGALACWAHGLACPRRGLCMQLPACPMPASEKRLVFNFGEQASKACSRPTSMSLNKVTLLEDHRRFAAAPAAASPA